MLREHIEAIGSRQIILRRRPGAANWFAYDELPALVGPCGDAIVQGFAQRDFLAEHNPAALNETSRRFLEAIDRGLWRPRRNSVREDLARWSGE